MVPGALVHASAPGDGIGYHLYQRAGSVITPASKVSTNWCALEQAAGRSSDRPAPKDSGVIPQGASLFTIDPTASEGPS
jgi:hypothetical protein